MGFPGGANGQEPTCCAGDLTGAHVLSLSQEDLLEEDMTTHASILAWILQARENPGKLSWTGNLTGCSP